MIRLLAIAAAGLVLAGCSEVAVPGIARDDRVIVVTGQGEASAEADTFTVSTRMTIIGSPLGSPRNDARQIATGIMLSYMTSMKVLGVSDAQLSIRQVGDPSFVELNDPTPEPSRMEVVLETTASLAEPFALGIIGTGLDPMLGAGTVAFTVQDVSALRREAAIAAVREARGQAEAIAEASGLRLGQIVSVDVAFDESEAVVLSPSGDLRIRTLTPPELRTRPNGEEVEISSLPLPAGRPTISATATLRVAALP